MSGAGERYLAAPARMAAFDVLLDVEQGNGHSDDLLRARKIRRLSEPDRNLTTALVLGVLRWQRALDAAVDPLLKRPGARLDAEVRLALRLGAYQLFFMDRIPARAAIDESVELTKAAGHRFAAGMVNAVLRRLAAGARPELDASRAYPEWMVERWRRHLDEAAAEAVCRAGMEQAAAAVRLSDAGVEQELRATGVELAPGRLLTAARIVAAGDLTAEEAFRAGRVRIQDEGSQLVAEIAAFAGASLRRILDACAAPGGKTLILAERNPEARIVACEASAQRHAALAKRLAGLGARVECRLADAAALGEAGIYDAALVDAPCSGTGTLGRNPEIRHRIAPGEFARQAQRQRAILAAAVCAVRPGGVVIYSTCSLEPEENERVVEAMLAAEPRLRLAPLRDRLEAMARAGVLTAAGADALESCVTAEGYLRLLPGALGTDGFFIALLERTA